MKRKLLCALMMLLVLGSMTGCAAFRTFPKLAKAPEQAKKGKSVEGRLGDGMETYFFRFRADDAYLTGEYGGFVPEEGEKLLVVKVDMKNTYR